MVRPGGAAAPLLLFLLATVCSAASTDSTDNMTRSTSTAFDVDMERILLFLKHPDAVVEAVKSPEGQRILVQAEEAVTQGDYAKFYKLWDESQELLCRWVWNAKDAARHVKNGMSHALRRARHAIIGSEKALDLKGDEGAEEPHFRNALNSTKTALEFLGGGLAKRAEAVGEGVSVSSKRAVNALGAAAESAARRFRQRFGKIPAKLDSKAVAEAQPAKEE